MKILTVNNLSKVYGKKIIFNALNDINFSIEDGEFVGIMGPSGSGKTTLLNMISTIDKPTTGTMELKGKNPLLLRGEELALFRRRELGFVFQDFNLLDTLTIGENIVLPLTLDKVSVKEQDETVALLSKLDVDKHIDVEIKLDELDLTSAESKATYAQIKEYVLEKFGLKVSTLYIAQIKKKCGIELREHYNKSKKDNQAIPQCTPEKEEAIMDALRHFKMI